MSGCCNRRWAALLLATGVIASGAAQADIDSARQALQSQHYDQALSALDDTLASRPDDPEARFLKGLALANDEQTRPAIAIFEQLTADHPEHADGWNNLGVLYARQGKLSRAADALRKAVDLDTQYESARENLGDVYVALAQGTYRAAARLDDSRGSARDKSAKLTGMLGSRAPTRPETNPAPDPQPEVSDKPRKSAGAASEHVSHVENAVASALRRWAHAWSDRDVQGYLATYSDDYEPGDGRSLVEWIQQRSSHLRLRGKVQVKLSGIHVRLDAADRATATFEQHYQSSRREDDGQKRVLLVREDGDWRIRRES